MPRLVLQCEIELVPDLFEAASTTVAVKDLWYGAFLHQLKDKGIAFTHSQEIAGDAKATPASNGGAKRGRPPGKASKPRAVMPKPGEWDPHGSASSLQSSW